MPLIVADLEVFLDLLLPAARASSLALGLLKLTAPGVPDLYQVLNFGILAWWIPTIADRWTLICGVVCCPRPID